MSIHHVECAAMTKLPASTKLVLMAVADSADKDNRVGFPGLDNVMAWSGLGRSRALEVATWLAQRGYILRVGGSRPGRRAEYLVFPAGCCAQHGRVNGYDGPDPLNGSDVSYPNSPNGSDTPDVNSPNRSGTSDANNSNRSSVPDVNNSNGSAVPDPFEGNGSDFEGNGSDSGPIRVRSRADPSPPSPTPSIPPSSGGGGGGTNPEDGAEQVLDCLGPSWPLGRGQRQRLTPKIEAALASGWTVQRLTTYLAANPQGVKAPGAVLSARLADLPDPPSQRESDQSPDEGTLARLAVERSERVDTEHRAIGRVSLREMRETALRLQREGASATDHE